MSLGETSELGGNIFSLALKSKKIFECVYLLVVFLGYVGGLYGLFLGLKLLIKAWGHIPILVLSFLEPPNFRPNLDPWTPFYYQNTLKNTRKCQILFKHIIFTYIRTLEFETFGKFGKDRQRKMMKIRLTNLEHLVHEINILQKTWNGKLIIFKYLSTNEGFLNLWKQETKKLWNGETKKPRNQESTKPRNQKPRNQTPRSQETKNQATFQVRESPAPINIPMPGFMIRKENLIVFSLGHFCVAMWLYGYVAVWPCGH